MPGARAPLNPSGLDPSSGNATRRSEPVIALIDTTPMRSVTLTAYRKVSFGPIDLHREAYAEYTAND